MKKCLTLASVILVSFPSHSQQSTFQEEALAAHNESRELVSEALGILHVELSGPFAEIRQTARQRLIELMAKSLEGISPPYAPLGSLEWDEDLEEKAILAVRSCGDRIGDRLDASDPEVARFSMPIVGPGSEAAGIRAGLFSHTADCLTNHQYYFYDSGNCKLIRLHLREDARRVGCAFQNCGESNGEFACTYDVEDTHELPWQPAKGPLQAVTVYKDFAADRNTPREAPISSDSSLPRQTIEEARTPQDNALVAEILEANEIEKKEKEAREKAAREFKPSVLDEEVHRTIAAAFVEEVGKMREQISTPRLVGLHYTASSRGVGIDDLLQWKPDLLEKKLNDDRERLRLEDGRDIFEILAAREPFPTVESSPELVEKASKFALKCSRPDPKRSLSVLDDLGDGHLGFWNAGKLRPGGEDPRRTASLIRKMLHQRILAYVGALAMVGEVDWPELESHAIFVWRSMVSHDFQEFGCSAAKCAPNTLGIACVIPKIDTKYTLTRTPYPSLFNDDPPPNPGRRWYRP